MLLLQKRTSPETDLSRQAGYVTNAVKRATTVQYAAAKQSLQFQKSSWETVASLTPSMRQKALHGQL